PAARRADASTVEFDDVPNDAESKSETAVLARRTAVALAESLEQMRRHVGLEADARIVDRQPHFLGRGIEPHVDAAAGRSEFDRVRNQVPDGLLHSAGVCRDWLEAPIEVEGDRDALRVRGRPQRVDRGLYERSERRRRERQLERAGDDVREVEQIVNQTG